MATKNAAKRGSEITYVTISESSKSSASSKVSKSGSKQPVSTISTPSAEPSTSSSRRSSRSDLLHQNQRYYNIISTNRFKQLQAKAEDAVKAQKTFLMRAYWPVVRRTFLKRGWIELFTSHYTSYPRGVSTLSYLDIVRNLPVAKSKETLARYTARCERYVLSRLIQHLPVSFTWSWAPNQVDFGQQLHYPNMIVSKLLVSPFTTKEGLAQELQTNLLWLTEENYLKVNLPRCFNTADPDEWAQFIENFRQTACISFLKYVLEKTRSVGQTVVFGSHAEIPTTAIEFALQKCSDLVKVFENGDIDSNSPNGATVISDRDWRRFFKQYQQLASGKARIRSVRIQSIDTILRNVEAVLSSLKPYWPEYGPDGYRNIWILKPADDSCGNGIQISNDIERITNTIETKAKAQKRYIIQKYIENPLTIYNTKFDIRQYFLVTNVLPLTIWMYKENYLRFSTSPFSLDNFHECIHITNNAIQRKYKVDPDRDPRLPHQNMWDCYTFQEYLRQIGKGEMWSERIYPGIRQAIIGTVLASQAKLIQRDNTFQLYGADFLLSEDCKPWILEVNRCPDLALSTNVTARIVPQLIEDLFKVVVDRRQNPLANTGNFEQIYTQSISLPIKDNPPKLSIAGEGLNTAYNALREMYQHLIDQSSSGVVGTTITDLKSLRLPVTKKVSDDNSNLAGKNTTPMELQKMRDNLKNITRGS